MEAEALLAAFLSHCRAGHTGQDELKALVAQKIESARRHWPGIFVDPAELAIEMATRLREDEDALAGLRQLREADLYLTCAVARGVPRAMDNFESMLLSRVGAFVARIDPSPTFVDEVKQALRIKLFVGCADGGSDPKINQYSGRSPLESWICAAAIRTAYDLRRSESRRQLGHDDAALLVAGMDVELEVLRARYEVELRSALQDAIVELKARQRTLLRLYFLEQLTTAQIGRLYQVHETTVLRWIAQARQQVGDGVRSSLKGKLRVSQGEFDELIGLLQSRIDVSFHRMLEAHTHADSTV